MSIGHMLLPMKGDRCKVLLLERSESREALQHPDKNRIANKDECVSLRNIPKRHGIVPEVDWRTPSTVALCKTITTEQACIIVMPLWDMHACFTNSVRHRCSQLANVRTLPATGGGWQVGDMMSLPVSARPWRSATPWILRRRLWEDRKRRSAMKRICLESLPTCRLPP